MPVLSPCHTSVVRIPRVGAEVDGDIVPAPVVALLLEICQAGEEEAGRHRSVTNEELVLALNRSHAESVP
jgi:hypothetical protein